MIQVPAASRCKCFFTEAFSFSPWSAVAWPRWMRPMLSQWPISLHSAPLYHCPLSSTVNSPQGVWSQYSSSELATSGDEPREGIQSTGKWFILKSHAVIKTQVSPQAHHMASFSLIGFVTFFFFTCRKRLLFNQPYSCNTFPCYLGCWSEDTQSWQDEWFQHPRIISTVIPSGPDKIV